MARFLVTGGAGYIGSHMVRRLLAAGHEPVVLDSLAGGHADAVGGAELVRADIRDRDALRNVLSRGRFEAVFHFAGLARVAESVERPLLYYDHNVAGGLALLRATIEAEIPRFVFSSSASVYGVPARVPIPEDAPLEPVCPYGRTKRMMELALSDLDRAGALRFAALRYFNAAGAALDRSLGERHDPETHLIPLVLRAAATGEPVSIHGDDYPTPDGTCVRDYVHVEDLVDAHVAALERLRTGAPSRAYNLGTGMGCSVREIVEKAREITGRRIPVRVGPRRPGDPPVLVADPSRAGAELGFRPDRSDLGTILTSAWNRELAKPPGR